MAKRSTDDEDGTPLDPVALSLAIWLALLTCVICLSRLAVSPHGLDAPTAQGSAGDAASAYRTALAFST